MRRLLSCRRTYIATLAIITLGVLGWRGADVASAIAAVAMGLAAANGAEAAGSRFASRGLIKTGPVNALTSPYSPAEGGLPNGVR